MARKTTTKGPLAMGVNPAKRAGSQVPTNATNGEKTIPVSQRLKGITGGPARLTKANRGVK